MYGDGVGRYGTAQLPDVHARPDGSIAPDSQCNSGLARIEWHTTPKWDLYGYVGGEYAARTAYVGYDSVKVTNTPAIPGCGAVGQQPLRGWRYPARVSSADDYFDLTERHWRIRLTICQQHGLLDGNLASGDGHAGNWRNLRG